MRSWLGKRSAESTWGFWFCGETSVESPRQAESKAGVLGNQSGRSLITAVLGTKSSM